MVLTLSLQGCSKTPEIPQVDHAIEIVELVDFQQHQVTTDLVSIPEGIGLCQIGYGWWQETDSETGESWLRLAKPIGQLEIFSADRDLAEIELELSGNGSQERQRPIHIRLNGERLEKLRPPQNWTRVHIDVPPEIVQRGYNLLEISQHLPRDSDSSNPDALSRLRLRRLRTRSHSDRKLWPARSPQIRTVALEDSSADSGRAIEMPVASYLELVLTVPTAAHLQGLFQFEPSPESPREPAYLYVQLLDESTAERTLFHKRFYKPQRRPENLVLDLSPWSGQMVRIRIGATGSGNGVFRWPKLRLSAAEPVSEVASLPPIVRQVPTRSGQLGKPDVLMIMLDAARADAFSPFGGPYATPAAERLASDGTVFAQARSPSPWTGQSVPAILTGLFPDTLGVGPWGSRLPETVPTLAESMAQAGYRTVLWSQHPLYSNHDSFRRGFEEYYRSPKGKYQVLPPTEALMARDRPTFAFVHLIPPHTPYTPPAPFRGAYSSWYEGEMPVDAAYLNSFTRRRDPAELTEEDRRYAFDRYLENAAFADLLVGRILASLDDVERYDDTLIILLSDHGEAFLEHGQFLHTVSVHREFLHVPLVIKWPRSAAIPAGETVTDTTSLVDLVPTLVDGLALPAGAEGYQGRSLLPAAIEKQSPSQPIYSITRGSHAPNRPPNTKLMLEMDGWRLLWTPQEELTQLYRPETDPLETRDLSAELPLQTLALRQSALAQWHTNRQMLHSDEIPEEVEELDPEVLEQLEALGYLN